MSLCEGSGEISMLTRNAVPCHNDSTFLYTDPPSAIGAWIALEECTSQNGCLVCPIRKPYLIPKLMPEWVSHSYQALTDYHELQLDLSVHRMVVLLLLMFPEWNQIRRIGMRWKAGKERLVLLGL